MTVSSPLINVNLGGTWSNPEKVGFAAIGQTANDVWNTYAFPYSYLQTIGPLKWSDNTTSPVSLTVANAPGIWGNGSSDPMFASYIYRAGGDITITISDLPTGTYHVYVYGHEASPQANAVYELRRSGVLLGYKGTTLWGNAWSTLDWEEGQHYVVFRNVAVNSQALTLTVHTGGDGYAYANGLQIVPSAAVPLDAASIYRILNVDYGGDPSLQTGFAATGQSANDFWNGYAFVGIPDGSKNNLHWGDNSVSSINLTVQNAAGYWGNSTGNPMYDSYIYPWGGNTHITSTLSSLPTGIYDFYIYGHAASDNANGIYQLSVGGTSYGPKGTTIWGSGWNSGTFWEEGQQYIVFRNVMVSSGQTVSIDAQPNASSYAYLNGLQVVYPLDRDQDGLPDWWELQYLGSLNQTGSDDLDYDGLTNLQEYQAQTNPADANSASSVRLGYWRFNDVTFTGEQNQIPRSLANVTSVASWSGNAAKIDNGSLAFLRYNDVENAGLANINCRAGTIRFWFSPDWNSGVGPGAAGKLITVGSGWELGVNATGTQLSFTTLTDGTHLTANISWTAGQWHNVCLTYSPTTTALYIDGSSVATGSAVLHFPDLPTRSASGLNIGADISGNSQAKGIFDELETFNYPMAASDIGTCCTATAPLRRAQIPGQ